MRILYTRRQYTSFLHKTCFFTLYKVCDLRQSSLLEFIWFFFIFLLNTLMTLHDLMYLVFWEVLFGLKIWILILTQLVATFYIALTLLVPGVISCSPVSWENWVHASNLRETWAYLAPSLTLIVATHRNWFNWSRLHL